MNRRNFMASTASAAVLGGCAAIPESTLLASKRPFPEGFLWGASTAGHQIEGANVGSDLWYLENLPNTAFEEPSGDAVNNFNLWPQDLDLVQSLGLNTYRFSVEWSRIEPIEGVFSRVMIDHYRNIIEGCLNRGLAPILTFNHFTAPLWFSADGGWTNPNAPARFTAYCTKVAEELSEHLKYAVTLNEPQIVPLLQHIGLPDFVVEKQNAMLADAERRLNVSRFAALNVARYEDVDRMQKILVEAHVAGRNAIKKVRPDLPVGVSIAMFDDEEAEPNSKREEIRRSLYSMWLAAAKEDDFIGVQNYERKRWTQTGSLPPEKGLPRNFMGAEVFAPSLAGAVKYAHQVTGRPVLVTEHGVGTDDDTIRQAFIPKALGHLKSVMDEGVPVLGYCHWSLLDNFEWTFGYGPKYGLVAVDRASFKRTPKTSAKIYGAIARSNMI